MPKGNGSKQKDSVEQLLWDKLEFESTDFKTPDERTKARKAIVAREQDFYAELEQYDATSLGDRGKDFAQTCKALDAKLDECHKTMLGDDGNAQTDPAVDLDKQITTVLESMATIYSKRNIREYSTKNPDFRKVCRDFATVQSKWSQGQQNGWKDFRLNTLNERLDKVISYEKKREQESKLSFGQSAKLTLIKMAANISVCVKRVLGRGNVSQSYAQEVKQMKVRLTSKSLARSVAAKMIQKHTAKKKLAVLETNKKNIMKTALSKGAVLEEKKAAEKRAKEEKRASDRAQRAANRAENASQRATSRAEREARRAQNRRRRGGGIGGR